MTEPALARVRAEKSTRACARGLLLLRRVCLCLVPALGRMPLSLLGGAVVVEVALGLQFQEIFARL